ncbi:MAG: ABC transporter permease subunit [Bacteroidetes bacterium]|nr:ABC transporter permease subunit [Bacteroidota bacterium]
MITHLFRFEWMQLWKSWSFRISAVIIPFLIAYSVYLGHNRVADQHQHVQVLQDLEETFYAEMAERLRLIERGEYEVGAWFQDPANPIVLAQFGDAGRHVILHPKPLAALAAGQSDLFPYYGKVTLTNRVAMRDNAFENPVMQVTGQFDFAFVLVWLIPLFVIVLGYDVLSREKESGTYALLQSQPISIANVLLLKTLFRFLVISGIVIGSLLLFGAMFGVPLFNFGGLQVVLVVLLYIAFWFSLCVLINLYSDRSAVNAIILAGLWVFFVLILPALITLYAGKQHPVPSRAMWVTEQRAIEQSVNRQRDVLFESWKADHPEEVVEGDTPIFYQAWLQRLLTNEMIQERIDEAADRFNTPRNAQAGLINRLRLLSPPMYLQHWFQQTAGTDSDRLQTLDEQMRAFQQEWQAHFIPRFRQLDFFTSEEIQQIPRFE